MQQITPIEIRQKNFEKSFRGYQPDEFSAFLHTLSHIFLIYEKH
jgi:DivIVA domain-containing protein